MPKIHATTDDAIRSATAVRTTLRDIGYVLWLSRMIAKEIEAEKSEPVRPDMAEFCAFDSAAFVA